MTATARAGRYGRAARETTRGIALVASIVAGATLATLDPSVMPGPVALSLGLVALGLVTLLDAMLAGVLRRERHVLDWLWRYALAFVLFLAAAVGLEAGGSIAALDGTQGIAQVAALALMSAAPLAVALAFGRALDAGHAVVVWLGACLATFSMISAPVEMPLLGDGQYFAPVGILLVAAATAPLFVYVRTGRGARRRGLGTLVLAADMIAYGTAVAVALAWFTSSQVSEMRYLDLGFERVTRLEWIAAEIRRDFSPQEVAEVTPPFSRALLRYAALGGMDLYVFSVRADEGRVTSLSSSNEGGDARLVVGAKSSVEGFGRKVIVTKLERVEGGLRSALLGALSKESLEFTLDEPRYDGGPPVRALLTTDPGSTAASTRFAPPDGWSGVRAAGTYEVPTANARWAREAGAPDLTLVATSFWSSDEEVGWWRSDGERTFVQGLIATVSPWAALALVLPVSVSLLAYRRAREREAREHALLERQRIQQDAHDKVYNRLAALSKRVAVASDSLTSDISQKLGKVSEDIRNTVTDLQEILGDVRRLDHELDGRNLLASQLAQVCEAQAARLDLEVRFAPAASLPDVPPSAGWDVQCIVEEAITNAARHGGARHVEVSVAPAADGCLELVVQDDGRGMESTPDIDALPASSTGLRGMRDRVSRLGGELRIASGPEGTRLTALIPIGRA